MFFVICICDLWSKREYFEIDAQKVEKIKLKRKISENSELPLTLKRCHVPVDGISVFYLIRELVQFTAFRTALSRHAARNDCQLLWLEMHPPVKEIIDYKFNHMVSCSLWEHIEIEHLMSWLSTLGGGFSALGEQFNRCAETAGKISLRQLSIGLRLGDPFLQARCKLYYSISLIQTGRLRAAKHLIRREWNFAIQHKEKDGRLVKMCQGIWLRLQYEYKLRSEQKKREQCA